MLSNIVRLQKVAMASKLIKKGFLDKQLMGGARSFSTVMGGQEGSTVSEY